MVWKEATFLCRRLTTQVDPSPAMLAAQRQALQYTDGDQRDGSKPAGSLKSRHQADEERTSAHHGECNQEGVLAAYEIPDPSEEECAKWPYPKTHEEGGKIRDESERVISCRIELSGKDRRKAAKTIEVVPLDHGPDR